jgi:hypothetical protein
VIPSSDLKAAIATLKADSYKSCYDEACQIEVGREVAAQKTLATRIGKLGERCVFTSTLYDLGRAASERGASEVTDCKPETFLVAIDRVAVELRSGESGAVEAVEAPASEELSERSAALAEFFRFAGLGYGDTQHVARAMFGKPVRTEKLDEHGAVRETFASGIKIDYRNERIIEITVQGRGVARVLERRTDDEKLALVGVPRERMFEALGDPDLEYLGGEILHYKVREGGKRANVMMKCFSEDEACNTLVVQYIY